MTAQTSKVQFTAPRKSVLKWLLAGDPSIRYQVMRDLTGEPAKVVAAERRHIATEGWGADILKSQSPEGNWGGEPDRRDWMRTIYTLTLLKDFGIDPADREARRAIERVRKHITWWQLDGRPFFDGETEPCLNGRILGIGAYFGHPSERLLERLLGEQLEDGGWNCEAPKSRRSSFHTTICVLEGLLDYERATAANPAVKRARRRAQGYLLNRRLFRSRSTGEVIDRKWLKFSYPTIWHYDVLRGLEYMRDAGVKPDERVVEAVELMAKKQHQNGRWPLQNPHPESPLAMEGRSGTASRWNTLRALRVLKWYSSRD